MVGHDPTIRLPEFWGEASEDPEKVTYSFVRRFGKKRRSQMRIQISHS
jgi:hypothetical protein